MLYFSIICFYRCLLVAIFYEQTQTCLRHIAKPALTCIKAVYNNALTMISIAIHDGVFYFF